MKSSKRKILISALIGSIISSPIAFSAERDINGSNSPWEEDVVVNSSDSLQVKVTGSGTWQGDADVDNSDLTVDLDDSNWQGGVDASNDSKVDISATNNSSWQGTATITDSTLYVDIDNSSWSGNSIVSGADTTANIAIYNNSSWTGDLELSDKAVGSVAVSEQSTWAGNANVTDSTFYGHIWRADWIGDLEFKDKASGTLNVGESTWEGNATVTDSSLHVTIDRSGWIGDVEAKDKANVNITIPGTYSSPESSTWKGNATASDSMLNIDVRDASDWTGDLEFKNGSSGTVSISNLSTWEGKSTLTDSDLTVGLGMSTWKITGDSTVTDLMLNSSTLEFAEQAASQGYTTLTVTGDYTSNDSLILMNTDIRNYQGDLLDIQGASETSTTSIQVNNNGSIFTTGTETLTIVKTVDGNAVFELTNLVEVGGYEYGLRRTLADDTDWELYCTGGSSTTTDAGINIFLSSYLLNYAETQVLIKRLGDLRDNKHETGLWYRGYGGSFSSDKNGILRGFEMDYWGIQAGYDKKFERQKGTDYVGGFLGYSRGTVGNNVGGTINSTSLGAYWTHLHHNDFYADTVLKYNWMKGKFSTYDTAGDLVHGKDIKTKGLTGSVEVGRRYFLDQQARQGFYIEPQVQMTFGYQSGRHFTASNGLNIKADGYRSERGRLEVRVGHEVKDGKNPINIYGKFGVVKEFEGDLNYKLNGWPEKASYRGTWKVWGLGLTAQIDKNQSVYFDIERATGGKFTQDWGINGGYRISW